MWGVACSVLAIAATAMAQPGVPGPQRHPEGPGDGRPGMRAMGPRHGGFDGGMGGLARELNLSAEQRERIAAIRDRVVRRRIHAMADVRIAELDMRRLLRDERPDQRAMDAQIDRIASMRAQIAKARVAAMFEMRAALTADQRDKLRELREMGPMGGPGMRGRGMRGDRPDGDDDDGPGDSD
jgi:Spy/CpxP family protein refolding chaperone